MFIINYSRYSTPTDYLISDSMAGEGSRPLPIRPGRSSVGSVGGISSGSAASRRTLVATSAQGRLTTCSVFLHYSLHPIYISSQLYCHLKGLMNISTVPNALVRELASSHNCSFSMYRVVLTIMYQWNPCVLY